MVVIYPSSGWGSSPRVRGTRAAANDWREVERDHPRVCGEHAGKGLTLDNYTGSSPRVRGTLGLEVRDGPVLGIIPACAGNTSTASRPSRSTWDHPRVCGEHPLRPKAPTGSTGSSPRVRGTRSQVLRVRELRGIIPACAGNTQVAYGRIPNTRDHPRVCGEHDILVNRIGLMLGSSPRVRGTQGHAGDSR